MSQHTNAKDANNDQAAIPQSTGTAVIRTQALSRHFGDTIAVDGLSLDVYAGEIFGVLGHNGAGKTTTVRLLNGVLPPSAGTIRVLGLDPTRQGPELRRHTGVLTETPSLDERLTARENLQIYADLYGVPRAEVAGRVAEMLATFELSGRADEKVGGYSKGMKQRLALARALLHRPDLLFLDEPAAGLDPVAARQLHDLILRLSREEQRTIFLCTHNLNEAQKLCDRVAVLEQGRLIALGSPHALGHQMSDRLHLEIAVDAAFVRPALDALDTLEGVHGVAENGGQIRVIGAQYDQIPQLVTTLVAAGVPLYRVAPQEPTLEDVYFALHRNDRSIP